MTGNIPTEIAKKSAGIGSGRKKATKRRAKKARAKGTATVDSVFKKSIS